MQVSTTELQKEYQRRGKAAMHAQMMGWPEANYRDAGRRAMERIIREGYAWDEHTQVWQKVGMLTGEITKL